MSTRIQFGKFFLLGLLSLAITSPRARAQEKPINLGAEITSGFFSTDSQGSRARSLSSVPTNLKLDLSGFLGHPDFLSFGVQPSLTTGAQSQYAGFREGNGIGLSAGFLRKRAIPLTVRYANFRFEQADIGGFNPLAGLRVMNREKNFGLTSGLRFARLPKISLHYDVTSSSRGNGSPMLSPEQLDDTVYGASIEDELLGWRLNGNLRWSRLARDFINIFDPNLRLAESNRKSSQYQFNGSRPLWKGTSVQFNAGWRNDRGTFDSRRTDQNSRSFSASMGSVWGRRWRSSFNAGHTVHSSGTFLREWMEALTPEGTTDPRTSEILALLLPNEISLLTFSGTVSYRASRSWRLFGGATERREKQPEQTNGLFGTAARDFFTTRSGVSFNRTFGQTDFSAQYDLGLTRVRVDSVRPGSTAGSRAAHNINLRARRGTLDKLELTASLRLSERTPFSDTRLGRSSDRAVRVSLGRGVGGFVVRGSIGRTGRKILLLGESRTSGMQFGTQVAHRRFEVGYSRDLLDVDSFPFLPSGGVPTGISPTGIALGIFMRSSLTDRLNLKVNGSRSFGVRVFWYRVTQKIKSAQQSQFENLEFSVVYRLRQLRLEAGYSRYDQTLLAFPGFGRERIFVRVSRRFGIF